MPILEPSGGETSEPRLAGAPARALDALGAEVLELGASEPIRLDREAAVFVVDHGKIELFAVPSAEDGARTHLGTVTAGHMLFGLRTWRETDRPSFLRSSSGQRATALLAVASPGTLVVRAPIPLVIELARQAEHRDAIVRGVEAWVDDLFGDVPHSAAPQRFEPLEASAEVELAPGEAARTARGVVWTRHLRGASTLLGLPELMIDSANALLPISDSTWIVGLDEGATISCVDTAHLVASGGVWEGLNRFHDLFLEYVELLVDAARRAEADRLVDRARLDDEALDGAARRLVSVLDSGTGSRIQLDTRDRETDAVAAAMSLVLERHGVDVRAAVARPEPSNALQELYSSTSKPAPAPHHKDAVISLARASGVRHRGVVLRGDWWRRDNGPLLGFLWRTGEPRMEDRLRGTPVALLPVSPSRYELVDPAGGRREAIDAAVADELEGEAFMFYEPLPERPVGATDLARLALHRRRSDLLTIVGMGALSALLALLVPLLTGYLFGTVIPAAERPRVLQIALALGVAAVASFGFRLTRAIAILRLSGKLDGSVQAAVWDRLVSLPVSFFKRYTSGDLLDRSMGVDHIRTIFLGHVTTSFLDSVFSIASLGLLFYYSWRLALIAVGVVAVLIVFTVFMVWLQVRHQRRLLFLQGKLTSLVSGLLGGIQKLRGAGAEARAFDRWASRFAEMRRLTLRVRHLANAQTTVNAVFHVLAMMVLFASMFFIEAIELSVSQFLAFIAAYSQFQTAALSFISLLSSVLIMVPLYERLRPVLENRPEVDDAKIDAGELSGDVELSHVSFRYDERGPLVLDDVSIRARPGEFVALVGPSGSGKSTILRLLLGFEEPESGSIYFDGQDLPSLDVLSVRRQMGVVLQNGEPMAGDIYRNIVGTSNLGLEEATEAARMAGLLEDIETMPMGMHTIVSEGGVGFSGGQVQRLMIARAIVHRPRVLLFDEATSALDNRTQDLVSRSLEGLKATRIVVAHRLSTIRNADRIYVLVDGRLVERGTYDELAAAGGHFSALAARQLA